MGRTIITNVNALLTANKARERLDGELAAARSIQIGILPSPGGKILSEGLTTGLTDVNLAIHAANFAVAFVLEPAKEVGGDFYDVFTCPDGQVALIIGDVSGKGVPAALFMSMSVTLVRQALLDSHLTPAEAMTRINKHLTRHNPSSMFVTLFISLYDPATRELDYANGGHCQPLVGSPKGLRLLEGLSGPVVGALEDLDYLGFKDRLETDETILLYTDGVTEAQDPAGNFFGLSRLEETASKLGSDGPKVLTELALSSVKDFRGEAPPSDDVALLAFSAGRG
jgi:sigma-B regulation protein RsbU (phosphoserine phosphatase)